jgi:hypothetical protein
MAANERRYKKAAFGLTLFPNTVVKLEKTRCRPGHQSAKIYDQITFSVINGSLVGGISGLEYVQDHGYADKSSVIPQSTIFRSRLLFTRSTGTRECRLSMLQMFSPR